MNINLNRLLPEDISDEVVFHLVEIFSELAFALEEYYFASGQQCVENNNGYKNTDGPTFNSDDGDPF